MAAAYPNGTIVKVSLGWPQADRQRVAFPKGGGSPAWLVIKPRLEVESHSGRRGSFGCEEAELTSVVPPRGEA